MIDYIEFQKYTPKFKILEHDISLERAMELEKEAALHNACPHKTTLRSVQSDFCGEKNEEIQ